MTNQRFINIFSVVLGTIVGITAIILIIALYLSSAHEEMDLAMRHSMEQRLAPIGKVHIGSVAATAQDQMKNDATNVIKTTTTKPLNGKNLYTMVCAACHLSGVANAPIFGDKAAWAPRVAQGVEALYTASLNGKGAMPAKGGRSDLSDEAIKSAVDYMLRAAR